MYSRQTRARPGEVRRTAWSQLPPGWPPSSAGSARSARAATRRRGPRTRRPPARDGGAERLQLAVREDVAVDEATARVSAGPGPTRDLVVEEPAARAEQPCSSAAYSRVLPGADVLGHADAGDRVERPVRRRPGSPAPGSRPGRSARPRRSACGRSRPAPWDRVTPTTVTPYSRAAWMASGPSRSRRRAAACPAESELAADQLELVALGVLQVYDGVGAGPVGAGVDHRRAEHESGRSRCPRRSGG